MLWLAWTAYSRYLSDRFRVNALGRGVILKASFQLHAQEHSAIYFAESSGEVRKKSLFCSDRCYLALFSSASDMLSPLS